MLVNKRLEHMDCDPNFVDEKTKASLLTRHQWSLSMMSHCFSPCSKRGLDLCRSLLRSRVCLKEVKERKERGEERRDITTHELMFRDT